MALKRYARTIDGSIPIQALLYTDEHLLATQDGVGIYDGLKKSPLHQSGTIHASSHRLFYIDSKNEESASFAVDLSLVTQTEYYAGLFTSSPKVTLHLAGRASEATDAYTSGSNIPGSGLVEGAWECEVCAYKNPPGMSPSASQVCDLCGMPRSTNSSTTAPSFPPAPPLQSHQQQQQQLSSSLPSNRRIYAPSASTSTSTPSPPGSSPHTGTRRQRRPSALPCPACTFLNHPSLRECEICGTKLPVIQNQERQMQSAPTTRATSPELDDDDDDDEGGNMMKASFRKGGDKTFYTVLKRSLKSKAWESQAARTYKSNNNKGSDRSEDNAISRSGITGILRTVETSAQGREDDLKDALQDLEALMIKAKDMVRLAAELNDKLTAVNASASTNASTSSNSTSPSPSPAPSTSTPATLLELPEEVTFIRSSLSQLGLQLTNVPVTSDMIKDEDKWIGELARELAGVLKGMMKDRGIVALDEVWGGWNRARGVALLPPSTFLQVVSQLPAYTSPPISKRTFSSGLSVLHTPLYSQPAFVDRLTGYLSEGGPRTTMEVATLEGITVALTQEMVEAAEGQGDVLRDDAACAIVGGGSVVSVGGEVGVRWWPNNLSRYVWDGQVHES